MVDLHNRAGVCNTAMVEHPGPRLFVQSIQKSMSVRLVRHVHNVVENDVLLLPSLLSLISGSDHS